MTTVSNDFEQHVAGQRVSTELQMLQSIRRHFPDRHVQAVSPQSCDFLGFAKAGNASASEIVEFDSNHHFTMTFKPPSRKLDGESGNLDERCHYAEYRYVWQLLVYRLYWMEYSLANGATQLACFLQAPQEDEHGTYGQEDINNLVRSVGAWTNRPTQDIWVFDNSNWSKSAELWKSVQSASWEDVILDPKSKQHFIQDVEGFFESRDLYKDLGVAWKRGIILHGAPGNGKTISLKALISSLASREPEPIPTLYVKSFDGCTGPQRAIRRVFSHARANAPCLLIFEDLDSLVTDKVRSYFLNEVDGLESNDGILMVGSTNHLSSLDPAISKRPSRFDRKYYFPIPGETERTAYCRYWKKKLDKTKRVDMPEELCEAIAQMTDGFSFAYLQELFVAALLTVAHRSNSDHESDDGYELVNESNHGRTALLDAVASTHKASRQDLLLNLPEHLRDNALLKIFVQEIETLVSEMYSTNIDDWPSSTRSEGAEVPMQRTRFFAKEEARSQKLEGVHDVSGR